MRDSFIFYRSFAEGIRCLSKKDQLEAFWDIVDYAMDGTEPENENMAKAIFNMARPQIDKNNKRYENGCKGGRPKTKAEPKNNQTETKTEPNETKPKPNDNVNDNDNVNVNENVKEKIKREKYFPNDEKLDRAFCDYVDMRKKIKKPMTDRAVALAIGKLQKLAQIPFSDAMDNDLAIAILEQSVLNSWQGLFPLKDETRRNVYDEWRNA